MLQKHVFNKSWESWRPFATGGKVCGLIQRFSLVLVARRVHPPDILRRLLHHAKHEVLAPIGPGNRAKVHLLNESKCF